MEDLGEFPPAALCESENPADLPKLLAYHPALVQDLAYWERNRVQTPKQLGEHLVWAGAADLWKDRYGYRPHHWRSVEDARAYLAELDEEEQRTACIK